MTMGPFHFSVDVSVGYLKQSFSTEYLSTSQYVMYYFSQHLHEVGQWCSSQYCSLSFTEEGLRHQDSFATFARHL